MIRLRYHAVTLAMVLFAAATGVALGAGPLQGLDQPAETRPRTEPDARRHRELAAQQATSRDLEALIRAVAPRLVAGSLTGRRVLVIETPGVEGSAVADLRRGLVRAGGRVTGPVTLTARLLAPRNKQLVDQLAAQLLRQLPDVRVSARSTTYDRAGQVLGRALLSTSPNGAPLDAAARRVLSGYRTAGLLRLDGALRSRASLAVVVSAVGGSGPVAAARDTVGVSLVTALDRLGAGVVVVDPAGTPTGGRLVGALRTSPASARRVSSVAGVAPAADQVSTVLALAEQAAGGVGHYGGSRSPGGPVPGG